MSRRAVAFAALCTLGMGCSAPSSTPRGARATEPAPPPAGPASAPPPTLSAAPRAPRPLDALLTAWEKELPKAETLSEQNGASIPCGDGQYTTLTLLHASAVKLQASGEADLEALARWALHRDACIRQIALDAIVPMVGFDRNQLVVPHMHDPEHHVFHDILVSVHDQLGAKSVKLDAALFGPMMLDATADQILATVRGKWVEDHGQKGVQALVEVGPDTIAVTSKHLPADPKFPDVTWTSGLAPGTLDARRRYVVRGPWAFERYGAKEGPRQSPSPFVYSFWPVARDVVWFKDGESAYWIKLRRAT